MTEDTENTEEQHSRRKVMKGGAALGTAALISKFSSGVASAQTGTEPRLQLGDDWELDDYDDGSGNTNVRLRHIPSGAELRYSVADNAWIPSGQIGLPGDRPDAYLDSVDANSIVSQSASVTNESLVMAYRSNDLTGNSAGSFVNAVDTEDTDNRGEFNTSNQFAPDETGWYSICGLAQLTGGSDGDNIQIRLIETSTSNTVLNKTLSGIDASHFPTVEVSGHVKLDSGSSYEVQVRNSVSSYDITAGQQNTRLTIVRSLVAE